MSSPLTFKELINTILQEPVDKLMFQKHRQEIYNTLKSLSLMAGQVKLSSGTATVSQSLCVATSTVLLTAQDGDTAKTLAVTPGTGSFVIKSSNGSDSGNVGWLLIP